MIKSGPLFENLAFTHRGWPIFSEKTDMSSQNSPESFEKIHFLAPTISLANWLETKISPNYNI
jgi:hypothetical protein